MLMKEQKLQRHTGGARAVIDRLILIAFVALVGISLAVAVALLRARAEAARLLALRSPMAPDPDLAPAQAPDAAATLVLAPASAPVPPSGAVFDLTAANDPPDSVDWLAQAVDELRTPLGILRGQVEALRQIAAEGPRQTLIALAGRLVEQVEQAQDLVAAWSASAQGGPPRQPTSRAQVVEIVALARKIGAECAESACDVAPTPPVWAMLDAAPLARALAVAIQSAHTAMPGGMVEVVARFVGHEPDRRIGITIADRRPAHASPSAHLWDDLELDLTRTLLEDCGGWVECEPRGGGGRLVTFWLPGTLIRDAEIPTALPRSA
jgi:signal transduction histidine kinase